MPYTKTVLLFSLVVLFCFPSQAQFVIDTTQADKQEFKTTALKIKQSREKETGRFRARSLFIPAFMIAYGITSMEAEILEDINVKLNDEMFAGDPHKKISIDNYLQYAPAAAVYGLNALGIKGTHNFRDRTMICLMSNIFLATSVYAAKKISHELRPDGSGFSTFPSGHTAEAFAAAEFLRQEYKHISPWYGYAGYAVAVTTGYLRMYNNKHWLSDVVAGAGVGILSTRLAYWLYPSVKNIFFNKKAMNTMIMPYYQNRGGGLALIYRFRN